LSDGAGDEATDGEDAVSSLEAVELEESAKAGDAIDTAKAKTAQSMRLIEVMGAEARKWKQGEPAKSQQRCSKFGKDRRGPTMHASTHTRCDGGEILSRARIALHVMAADSMNTVNTIDLIPT
jgi:hypothetical protein